MRPTLQSTIKLTAFITSHSRQFLVFKYTLHMAEDYQADSSHHMLQGRSAVCNAANKGQAVILELLLSHGAHINAVHQEVLQH